MPVEEVANAVVYMASLPEGTNVANMTIMCVVLLSPYVSLIDTGLTCCCPLQQGDDDAFCWSWLEGGRGFCSPFVLAATDLRCVCFYLQSGQRKFEVECGRKNIKKHNGCLDSYNSEAKHRGIH